MKFGKKLLAFVLALVICLSLGVINSFAATPLTVASITPNITDTSVKVDVNSVIAIQFSNNVGNNAEDNKDKFIIERTDGTVVAYDVLFNTDDAYKQYVFIKPNQNLEQQTEYKLTIKKNVVAKNGSLTEEKLEYTFKTKNKAEATNDTYSAAVAAGVTFTSYSFNDSGSGSSGGVNGGNTEGLNFSGAYILNSRKDAYKDVTTISAGIPTDASIVLVFDGNMATNAEENTNCIILKDKNGQAVSKHMYFYDKNSGTMTPDPTGENKPQRIIYIVPDNALNPNEDYTIVLDAGITSGQSSRPLANPGTISFKTSAETGYIDSNFTTLSYVKVLPEATPGVDTTIGTTTAPINTIVISQEETVADTNDGNEIAVIVSVVLLSAGAVYVTNKARKD